MNGGLRPVPDPSVNQMTRELTERAQDKQAAVAMRGQDKQVDVNKAQLAIALMTSEHAKANGAFASLAKAEAYLAEFFQPTPAEDPLAEIPSEVLVQA